METQSNEGGQRRPRKVLFLDVPGVLNTSQSPDAYTTFEPDFVARVVEIVKRTGCEVYLSPKFPGDIPLHGYQQRLIDALVGLLHGLFPEMRIGIAHDAGEALAILGDPNKGTVSAYAVLLHNDDADLKWQLTFPARTIRTKGREGLSADVAKAIEGMLMSEVGADEIPFGVITKRVVLDEMDRRVRDLSCIPELTKR